MSDPHPQPLAPPTHPGAIAAPARPSNWPNVIGIIAIILGAGGVLAGVYSALSAMLMSGFMGSVPQGPAMMSVLDNWQNWTLLSSLAYSLVAILLLAGGILLVKRRRSAWNCLRAWAVMKILITAAAAYVGSLIQKEMFEAMQQDPNMPTVGGNFYATMGLFGSVFNVVWGWAFPAFILIWFARKKARSEMSDWS